MSDITLQEVAQELGLKKEKDAGARTDYYCPVHDNDSGDLSIYHRSHFGCHQEGGESPVTLLMHCKDWSDKDKAIEWLQEHFPNDFGNIDQETIDRKQSARKVLNKARDLAHDTLKKQKTEMLEDIKDNREFDDEIIEEAQIGFLSSEDVGTLENRYDKQALIDSGLFIDTGDDVYCHLQNRIVYPYMVDHETYFMIGRRPKGSNMDAKYKKTNTTDYNKHILYEFTTGEADQVIITEGVTDAISAYKAGYDVVSPVTTQFRQKDIERLVQRVESYDEVYLINDNDEAGEEGARKTAEELTKAGNEPFMVQLEKVDDLDDYTTMNGYDLSILLDNAERYLDLIADRIEDADRTEKAELKEKVFELVQHWSKNKRIPVWEDLPGNKREMKNAFKEWKEENESRQKNEEEIREEPPVEESDEITDSLNVNGSKIELNPVNYLNIKELERTWNKKKVTGQGAVKAEPLFKIYKVTFGQGKNEQEYRLIVDPDTPLQEGDEYQPIKIADLDKPLYQGYLKTHFKKAEENGFQGSFGDFLDNQEGRYFEIADELTEESRNVITSLSNQEIKEEVVEKYLNNGYNYDPKLTKLNHPKIIRHQNSIVDPEDVAQYAAHSFYVTGTNVGKSFNSGRVGQTAEDLTIAGLLGYSTADDVRRGALDGEHEAFFADEVAHGTGDHVNDGLLSLLDQGKHEQKKGKVNIRTEFYGSFTYMSNPQSKEDDLDEVDRFLDFLDKLGSNKLAMGSRFGSILFDTGGMKTANGKPLDKDTRHKLATVVEWIKKEIAKEYATIEEEMVGWLNQRYPEEYLDNIDSVKADVFSQKVKEFLEGHKEGFRHARGQALRMAVYEYMGDVLSQDYSIEEIRETADEKFQEVMEINLESVSKLGDVLSDWDRVVKRSEAVLEGEGTKYVKYFVKTVIAKSREDEDVLSSIEPVETLGDTWNSLKKDLDVSSSSRYWKWSRIRGELEDNLAKKHGHLQDRYGIHVTKEDDLLLVKIGNKSVFEPFTEVSSSTVPKLGVGDKSDASDTGKTRNNKDVCEGEGAHTKTENRENRASHMSHMSPELVKVVEKLQEDGSMNNTALSQKTGLNSAKTKNAVSRLESYGVVSKRAGVYQLVDNYQDRLEKMVEEQKEEVEA